MVCLIVCGDIDRPVSCGQVSLAVATASARRWVTFERVSFPPLRFGNRKLSSLMSPSCFFQPRIKVAVGRQRGTLRSLRPLPR